MDVAIQVERRWRNIDEEEEDMWRKRQYVWRWVRERARERKER